MPVVPDCSRPGEPAPRAGRRSLRLSRLMLLAGALSATAGTGNPDQPAVTGDRSADEAMSIPDRAMLQATELYGATTAVLDDDRWAHVRPPQPCADGAYPSAVLCRGSRAVTAVVEVNGTPAVAVEYVAVFRSNGARRYVRDLHRALDGCRGIDAQGTWKILDTGLASRESLLLRLRQKWEHAGETATKNTFVAVARVGRVLVVVADVGWEAGDGHRDLVEALIGPALRRANLLL
ncbi:hypothetical protein [Paractinoplanes rishiriensis]|uniref:PknH-like extracellular domain-containing protein n=1 Tax=Paractinoplanes rishiriensis TaxID=1050105 RepID=A0A919JX58_9ACTN|nr:hypothetical protein [Actinoplanes rishiriensis]GIE94894.1 hypothetical protein Ari01nite_23590 [Actinoplanes rishiriensis]